MADHSSSSSGNSSSNSSHLSLWGRTNNVAMTDVNGWNLPMDIGNLLLYNQPSAGDDNDDNGNGNDNRQTGSCHRPMTQLTPAGMEQQQKSVSSVWNNTSNNSLQSFTWSFPPARQHLYNSTIHGQLQQQQQQQQHNQQIDYCQWSVSDGPADVTSQEFLSPFDRFVVSGGGGGLCTSADLFGKFTGNFYGILSLLDSFFTFLSRLYLSRVLQWTNGG